MPSETRYQVTCGPDGEWGLFPQNTRRTVNVYETQVEPNALMSIADSPMVLVHTMGEVQTVNELCTEHITLDRSVLHNRNRSAQRCLV